MFETIVQNTRRSGPTISIARTYGLAKIAGTVNPTKNLSAIQDLKLHVKALKAHATISRIK